MPTRLNILAAQAGAAGQSSPKASARVVLTPHPGEMARLAGPPSPKCRPTGSKRRATLPSRIGVTLVLKGARTLIAHPDGRVAVNTTGNPGMAKGGSGDLLTGLIAGLLAQYPDEPAPRGRGGGLSARAGRGPGRARWRRAHVAGHGQPALAQRFLGLFAFDAAARNGYVWLQGALHRSSPVPARRRSRGA